MVICACVIFYLLTYFFVLMERVWVTLPKNIRKRETLYWKRNVMNNETEIKSHIRHGFYNLQFYTAKKIYFCYYCDFWCLLLKKKNCSCTWIKFVSAHYCPYCNKTLQSFFWSWALLCTPHRQVVKSSKGSDAAALSLSVVITTTTHYHCKNTIFSSSTLSLTCTHSDSELMQSQFDSNVFPLKCFPRR